MSVKILFVASKPAREAGLQLEKEITGIQLRASASTADPVEFTFLPDLTLEQLQHELIARRPDVLHLSAHGGADGALSLRREGDLDEALLTGRALLALLDPGRPPALVYLNACNSHAIAKELVRRVPFAIGSTAPITNAAARAGAVAFYDFVFAGHSLRDAHEAQSTIVETLSDGSASFEMCAAAGVDPGSVILHRIPRIEADFARKPKPGSDGHYDFTIRLVGCPSSTTQVVFFTDDEDFIANDNHLERDLCYVVRGSPVGERRTVMIAGPPWRAMGDHRLFAVGVTGDLRTLTASTTLCEALERRYAGDMPPKVRAAIENLRSHDGAGEVRTVASARR